MVAQIKGQKASFIAQQCFILIFTLIPAIFIRAKHFYRKIEQEWPSLLDDR